jgi:hypothetical protein
MNPSTAETFYWCGALLILTLAIVGMLKKKWLIAGLLFISGIIWNAAMTDWVLSFIPPPSLAILKFMNDNTSPKYLIPGEPLRISLAYEITALGGEVLLKDISIMKCEAVMLNSEKISFQPLNITHSTGSIPREMKGVTRDVTVHPYIALTLPKDNRLEGTTVSLSVVARLSYASKKNNRSFDIIEWPIAEDITFKVGESALTPPDNGFRSRGGEFILWSLIIYGISIFGCLGTAWDRHKQIWK